MSEIVRGAAENSPVSLVCSIVFGRLGVSFVLSIASDVLYTEFDEYS